MPVSLSEIKHNTIRAEWTQSKQYYIIPLYHIISLALCQVPVCIHNS